ncbi:MAG: amino acid adenylation domain-containing protein, partial [Chroococcales cyanobacterium]
MEKQSQLSAAKRALLAKRLKGKTQSVTKKEGISRRAAKRISSRSHSSPIPLSFSQQRLWFLQEFDRNNTAYNMPAALRIEGELDLTALQASLNTIIQRHEILRTRFTTFNNEPIQEVTAIDSVCISLIDLQSVSKSEQEAKVLELAKAEAKRPFDLTQDLLLRVSLIQLSTAEFVLLLTMHHIASDAWSIGVLIKEFVTLYSAFSQGNPSPLAELPIQYGDFALWQREWLKGDVLQQQLSYWKEQLKGDLTPLDLPSDRPRLPVQSFQGKNKSFTLSPQLTQKLKQLSLQEGVTLYMTLLAAFKVLLYRYSGQEDIVIGSPIANRNRPEIEGLIGFFVNTLVLRTQVREKLTFRELLQEVKEVALGAYSHSDLPFEYLVEVLQPERNLSHNPLFQVMFVLQNAPTETLALPGLQFESLKVDSETSQVDLALFVVDQGETLGGTLQYSTDLFDEPRIERILGHFQTLLEGIVSNLEQPIYQLPLLTPKEYQQLKQWNETEVNYPLNVTLHQLFEAQVEKTPNAVALLYDNPGVETRHGASLRYEELNAKANQLAHYLQSLGVKPDTLVGVCMQRSPLMVIALLGILKAGGAYVPLDPTYPSDRLAFMVKDAQVSVLLTEEDCLQCLPKTEYSYVCLDTNWNEIAQCSSQNPRCNVTSDNLAYTIYTSGSTGNPKGAMNAHQGVVNRLLWMRDAYDVGESDRILQKTPFSFDVSVWEFFLPLICGGTLVVARPEGHKDPLYLSDAIARFGITMLHFVPSMLQVFLLTTEDTEDAEEFILNSVNEGGEKEDQLVSLLFSPLPLGEGPGVRGFNLKRVICSGEALSVSLQNRFLRRFPDVELHNLYGPTEAAIDVTSWQCSLEENASTVPIGKPIANIQLYILDAYLQPVPVGIPGELHIGGVGVAKGYLNRPELTAEKFIIKTAEDTENTEERKGERLYKTGDLCRYREDGAIEYLGRIDSQVKLRGLRIELGEIEAALCQSPFVREAVVMAREDEPGNPYLAAYLVVQDSSNFSVSELRNALEKQLPDYMIPAAFVVLDEIPLTPNGKVNRRALPMPERERSQLENTFIAPRTALEQQLAAIWSQVLKIESVGIQDNFFALGGHSLLATQVVSRIRQTLQVELSLRAFFENPTIAGLAETVRNLLKSEESNELSPITIVDRNGTIPLSFAQQRLWFLDQFTPDNPFYNMPFAVRLKGELQIEALHSALQGLVQRHETLRTAFRNVGEETVQEIAAEVSLRLPVINLQELPENEREATIEQFLKKEAQQPFNLSQAPLIRTTLLQLSETEAIMLLTLHHIIADGWSLGVLVRDLAALYEAQLQQKPSSLPPLPVQYADFAVWQRQWLQGEVLETQLNYWRKQLENAPAVLELPTDFPRPNALSYQGKMRSHSLSSSLTQQLKNLSQEQGVTLFMTLLAAFKTLLYRYSGQNDILVGSPIANRSRQETEALIGFFANTLVLRSQLDGNLTFEQLLNQVKETTLGAYASQDIPFEQIVEAIQPERQLNIPPLFQVMFVLQNTPVETLQLPGLEIEALRGNHSSAKFDLTLFITETEAGLTANLEYSTDLFQAETIDRLLRHWETLLQGIVTQPNQLISQLPLLTFEEKVQLNHWNETATDYPALCLHSLVEMQVEKTPNAIAVMDVETRHGASVRYAELNAKANQLAHYLQSLGIGPNVPVGVCLERSPQMMIAVLGILKAGGAYVPLDPDYPSDRISLMLSDAQCPIVLTQEALIAQLPPHSGKTVCLEGEESEIASMPTTNPNSSVTPEDLAYIIYTSGSTGKPKGVAMPHQALSNLMQWQCQSESNSDAKRTLQFASLSFDVSCQEIFSTWISGGILVLINNETRRDAERLLNYLKAQQINRLFLPFVALQNLADVAIRQAEILPELQEVITAGEQLQISRAIATFFKTHSSCQLINQYGPSESHVVTAFNLTGMPDVWPALPPIGRPIANTQIYLLDANLESVPVGIPGEIYIGGIGLAKGYLNRPELT